MNTPPTGHEPVLLRETLELLNIREGQTIIDCTLGRAGHASAIASALGPKGLLIGIDVDPRNLEFAQQILRDVQCPVRLFHANFSELRDVLKAADVAAVDGILADLGVSTNQLLDSGYGLSFARSMPLDMRLDPRLGASAADLVSRLSETDLANVLYELAQERYSRRIARKIVEARRVSPITTTERLAELVRWAIPSRDGSREAIDPATRTFLALRMKVNREVENLSALLTAGPGFLKRGGRMAVISFQSMEDRAVKQAFRFAEQAGQVSVLTKRPLVPSDTEIAANPRSRSSKLRAIERL